MEFSRFTKLAFYHQNQLLIGEITAENNGLYSIHTLSGEVFELRAGRFVLALDSSDTLTSFIGKIHSLAEGFETRGIRLPESKELSLSELAGELKLSSAAEYFALYSYLKAHPELYLHKKDRFRTLSPVEQAAYREKIQRESARKTYLQEITALVAGKILSPENQLQLYGELGELLLEHRHKDLQQTISQAFPHLDSSAALQEFRLLCGELSPLADPAVAASGLPLGFAQLVDGEELKPVVVTEPACEAFCIDAQDTKDYDDALSLRAEGANWQLGIHVSAVAALVSTQGLLFKEARQRVSSLYTPNLVLPMFPARHSEQGLSLVQGELKPVLSLYVTLDKDYNVLSKCLKQDTVRIVANLSYKDVDKRIGTEPFSTLQSMSRALNARRDSQAETHRDRFFRYLRLRDKHLEVNTIDNFSPSRQLVEELMILFNSSVAEYALEQGIPALFRNVQQWGDPNEQNPATQAYLSTRASFHPGIGTKAYLHASSPVRRYVDLLNQANVLAALAGQALPYSAQFLDSEIERIEKRLVIIKETAQLSDRYWWLKYLEENCLHTPLDAVVQNVQNGRIRLELPDWGIQVWASCELYPRSERLKLVFTGVNWQDWLLQAEIL